MYDPSRTKSFIFLFYRNFYSSNRLVPSRIYNDGTMSIQGCLCRCVRLSRIVIAIVPDASTAIRHNRDNRKSGGRDIFSLVPRCTRSPARPSALDTETYFSLSFFPRMSSPRVSRISINECVSLPILRNAKSGESGEWKYYKCV